MVDYLANIPAAYVNVSPGFVETLIQSRREELFTGLMRLQYPSGEVLVFTFLDGLQYKLYRCLEKNTEVIARQSWQSSLDRPDASVVFVTMSVESMRVMKVVFDAPVLQLETITLSHQQLKDEVRKWAKQSSPSIVVIRMGNSLRMFLMSGISNPVIEDVSLADGTSIFSVNDESFPESLSPGDHQVIRCISDHDYTAWQDFELRLAFHVLMRLLINRFSELAGRMLTERLCMQISSRLKDESWNIKLTMNGITNRHFFGSLDSSIEAYLGILRCFSEEASPAIGMRMADGLSREVLLKMDAFRRDLLKRYLFERIELKATQETARR
jgi:hypothetical protein